MFAAGLIGNHDDEEEKRRAENQAMLDAYIKTAVPIYTENYLNTANSYLNLNRFKDVNDSYNQGNTTLSNPNSASNNNVLYTELTDAGSQNNVENKPYDVDYSLYGDDFSKEEIDEMLSDKEFNNILNEYIIPNEGGYTNDSNDSGGETNMGIAASAHPNEDIKNLTRERANAIYYRDYYKWNGLNKLPYPIRGFVVDYGLPTNPQNAIKTVHEVLDIPPGGTIIGSTTLGKFENYTDDDYNKFLEDYRSEMINHYNNVASEDPKKKKYLRGWLRRANRAHLAR